MIYPEAKKLHLIESLIKEDDEKVLQQVEQILSKPAKNKSDKFSTFSNRLTADELDLFEKNIQEGCEQINENDWK